MLEAQKRGRGRPKGAKNKQKPARPRSVRPCVACVTPDSASNQESVFANEFSALSLTSDASRRSQGESIVDSASTESGMPISQTDEPLVSKENREIRDTDSLDKNGSDDPVETVFGLESFRGCTTAQDLKSKISELFSNSQDSLFEYLLVLQSRVFQLENRLVKECIKLHTLQLNLFIFFQCNTSDEKTAGKTLRY